MMHIGTKAQLHITTEVSRDLGLDEWARHSFLKDQPTPDVMNLFDTKAQPSLATLCPVLCTLSLYPGPSASGTFLVASVRSS